MLVSPSQAVSSYKPNEDFIRAYQEAPHNRRWVITMNDGLEYVTVETVSSVRAGFMRGRGSIVWVVVPFNGAKDESKVGRFYFLSLSSSLNRIFHSRFWFLSNRGDLVMSSVKVISMTTPFPIMLARSSYAKTSRFLGRKIPRTHSYGSLWMTRRVLENELGRRWKRQTVVYMCRSRTSVTSRRLLLVRLDLRLHEFGLGLFYRHMVG